MGVKQDWGVENGDWLDGKDWLVIIVQERSKIARVVLELWRGILLLRKFTVQSQHFFVFPSQSDLVFFLKLSLYRVPDRKKSSHAGTNM